MGRPPKYKDANELREARKRQKREWYENHKDVVNMRRNRRRRDRRAGVPNPPSFSPTSSYEPSLTEDGQRSIRSGADALNIENECSSSYMSYPTSSPSIPLPTSSSSTSFILSSPIRHGSPCSSDSEGTVSVRQNSSSPSSSLSPPSPRRRLEVPSSPESDGELGPVCDWRTPASLDSCACIPRVLIQEVRSALRQAPKLQYAARSCGYWKSFYWSFTRDGFIPLARAIFDDLASMPDSDVSKALAYSELAKALKKVDNVFHALLETTLSQDPLGRWSTVKCAIGLDRKWERLSDVVCEMIYHRQDGRDYLLRASRDGVLSYPFTLP
ncbi:hypothetical protein SCHPADRAFT_938703 [Schizopora paradoxa]|uniref:Uncharacterized protein n=1 Tax=Schizopora paradoxa TaxID=27342 RepID=A0A0H2S148_9AGAM|nr:hypothetical protein SCHPADRAFT_938703 [Schizopora paradoxa]